MRTFQKKAIAASGAVGGWTLDNNAIFSGTKSLSEGFSSSGITFGSDGSIHAPRFYLNADGTVGIRSGSATGKRVVIDSVNNRIDIYSSSNVNCIRIDDTLNELYPYPGILIQGTAGSMQIYDRGIEVANNTESLKMRFHIAGSWLVAVLKDLPYSSGGVPSGLETGQLWRDGNNFVRIKV